jgi:hypothetical protein
MSDMHLQHYGVWSNFRGRWAEFFAAENDAIEFAKNHTSPLFGMDVYLRTYNEKSHGYDMKRVFTSVEQEQK